MASKSVRWIFPVLLALGSVAHAANVAPPIKPGLWQFNSQRTDAEGNVIGGVARMQERMKNLPPEARARMEAQMREHGQDPTGAGGLKVCLTKESLDQGPFQQLAQFGGCSTTYSSQTSSLWKWHTSCSQLKSESDGEAVFANAESYTLKTVTTSAVTGTPRTTTMTGSGKWLGADCGSVKPFAADVGRAKTP